MKHMKHIKKFNEEYTGYADFDYNTPPHNQPITKEFILEELSKEYIQYQDYELTDQAKRDLDKLAERTLYSFHEQLSYASENFEGQFEEIVNGKYK